MFESELVEIYFANFNDGIRGKRGFVRYVY